MIPHYDKPEDAVQGLVEAYRSLDVEEIILHKDFDLDARLFWESMGLPIDEARIAKSKAAFEASFRRDLDDEGVPDYRGVEFTFEEERRLTESFSIVQVSGRTESGEKFELKIPVISKDGSWRTVLHPKYDHF
jgi:hypothetical protein